MQTVKQSEIRYAGAAVLTSVLLCLLLYLLLWLLLWLVLWPSRWARRFLKKRSHQEKGITAEGCFLSLVLKRISFVPTKLGPLELADRPPGPSRLHPRVGRVFFPSSSRRRKIVGALPRFFRSRLYGWAPAPARSNGILVGVKSGK